MLSQRICKKNLIDKHTLDYLKSTVKRELVKWLVHKTFVITELLKHVSNCT